MLVINESFSPPQPTIDQGVPLFQIMENEFEFPADKRGLGGYFAESFLKKYCSTIFIIYL